MREVSDYTGSPELMDGRLKTLHPRVHGGLLGRRGTDDEAMRAHGIEPIDLLVVNLYPFAATIARPDCSYAEAIENIDIGGPAMLRAAAKNHADVTVLVDPADYAAVLAEIDDLGETSIDTRSRLAAKAFAHTARYDTMVASYLQQRQGYEDDGFDEQLALYFDQPAGSALRGEPAPARRLLPQSGRARRLGNHRPGAAGQGAVVQQHRRCRRGHRVRAAIRPSPPASSSSTPIRAAWRSRPTASSAYERAYRTDPTSAFGGIIAFNRELDAGTARAILERQFAEVIAAPSVATAALAALAAKPNLRLLATGDLLADTGDELEFRSVNGGLLLQQRDSRTHRCRGSEAREPPPTRQRASSPTCCSPGAWPSSSNPTPSCLRATRPRSASAPAR